VNDPSNVDRRRRRIIAGATTAALFGIAGCTDDPEEEDEEAGEEETLEDEGDRPADEDDEEEDVEDEGGEAEETTLRVTVETEDGDLVDGASVAIEGDEIEDEVETEPDGVALFSNIEPGQYSVEATAEGHGTAVAGVELEEGENEEIEVTLPPEGEERGQEEQNGEEDEDDAL
jgi:hypothetical protein